MVDSVESKADRAMLAAQKAAQGVGRSKMLQYMLARLAQPKAPARSNKEGIGRVLGTFLLPMIAQGAQTWKENYDQRGKNKADADVLYERLKNGETLSPEDQAFFAQMQKNYPDRYAPLPQAGGQQPAPQQPTPQGAQAPAPANNVDTSEIRRYIQQQLPQFENPADKQTINPGNTLTGAALAQEAEDRLREVLGGEPKGWLLNALSYGR